MAALNHIMVDLETLGVVPGCVGFSIGAVEFFPDRVSTGREFYTLVSIPDSLEHYLREEEKTKVEFWDKQSAEARKALDCAQMEDAPKLKDALSKFNAFLRDIGPVSTIRLWGNGADFDNPILRVMYDAADIAPHIPPYGGRCYRTFKNLDEVLGPRYKAHKMDRRGTHHNALDDAKSQAFHLMEFINALQLSGDA